MLLEYCQKCGISPYRLGLETGIQSRSVMTYVIRARKAGERGYLPPLEKLEVWAEKLKLRGDERRRFVLLGNLMHCPTLVVEHIAEMESKIAKLGR
jgi:hypothetical protein